jgi:hypothetical protein
MRTIFALACLVVAQSRDVRFQRAQDASEKNALGDLLLAYSAARLPAKALQKPIHSAKALQNPIYSSKAVEGFRRSLDATMLGLSDEQGEKLKRIGSLAPILLTTFLSFTIINLLQIQYYYPDILSASQFWTPGVDGFRAGL